jgi:small acid-soluble spore protein (thioredoxin-like protein)
MKSKPDDRSDNARKIQKNINTTMHNMELAEEMMSKTDNTQTKDALAAKNERRAEAIKGLREELKDEKDRQQKS